MNLQSKLTLSRLGIFLPLAFSITALSWWLLNNPQFDDAKNSLAIGSSIDLVILIPASYFFLIRKTSIPNITVIPITVLSFVIAYQVVPSDLQQTLSILEMILAPVELGIISWLIYQVHKIIRGVNKKEYSVRDFPEVLKTFLLKRGNTKTMANIISSEASLFYYTFVGWKKPNGLTPFEFSTYKSSGYQSVFILVLFLLPVETFVLHLWLQSYSTALAWVLTGISIYSFFFVLGDRNSIRHRPIVLEKKSLVLNTGLRWQVSLPYELIQKIELREGDENTEKFANLTTFGYGNVMLNLKEPTKIHGIYGIKKTANKIALSIDEREDFMKQLAEKLSDPLP